MAKAKAKAAGDKGDKGGKTVRVVTETIEEREEPGGELELPEEPDSDAEDEDADALAEIEALAGSGARYEIRRTAPAPFTGYVGTYSRDVFSPDLLQSEWGGGNFTLRVKNSKGGYVGSRQIQLAGEPHHKKEAAPPAPAASNNPADGQLAAVLSAINASNEAARKASEGQVGLLTTLVTSLIAREPPKGPDPLAMIASLKEVLRPEKGSDAGDVIKMFMQGLTMGKELASDSGDTSMLDVANKGIDMISTLASQQAAQAPARPATRPALPRPAAGTVPAIEAPKPAAPPPNNVAVAPTAQEKPPVTGLMQKLNWIKQQTVMLCRLAHAEKDPELYAEVFLDNLPEFITEEEIREQMDKPDAVARLATLNGNVAKFAPWFEAFRAEVVALIDTPDDELDEETSDAAGGDVIDDPDTGGGEIIEPTLDGGQGGGQGGGEGGG